MGKPSDLMGKSGSMSGPSKGGGGGSLLPKSTNPLTAKAEGKDQVKVHEKNEQSMKAKSTTPVDKSAVSRRPKV